MQPDYLLIPYQLVVDDKLQPQDLLVYGLVYWYSQFKKGKCTAGNDTLAELLLKKGEKKAKMNERAISNSLNRLEERGYVVRGYSDKSKARRKSLEPLIVFGRVSPNSEPDSLGSSNSEPGSPNDDTGGSPIGEQIKNIYIKEKKEITAQSAEDQNISFFIDLFKEVNPAYRRFFSQRPQRDAVQRLLKLMGPAKLERTIKALSQITSQKYAPRITSPSQLEAKLGDLITFVKQQGSGKYNIGSV